MKREDVLMSDPAQCKCVTEGLRLLLADLQIYYANLRGFHWNIRGTNFFTLHAKFEEMYLDTAEKADEIPERLLRLGQVPCNRYSQYLNMSGIKELYGISEEKQAIENILGTYDYIIDSERKLLAMAADIQDEVTADMMVNFLKEHEKMVWMFSAYLA